jgi:hypothetical protein
LISALSFVNREKEAFMIARYAIQNSRKSESDKYFLITSGQMYGSGKTEMGKNAIKALAQNPPLIDSLKKAVGDEDTNKYLNSTYVMVDLQTLESSHIFTLFETALAFQLYKALQKYVMKADIPSIAQFNKDFPNPSLTEVGLYIKAIGINVFIHWDEVKN